MAGKAELIGIARKARSRAPMESLDRVDVTTDLGVDGDYRGKLRRRQVTILAEEDWQAACAELDRNDIPWTERRANLLVRGIALPRTKGSRLSIGNVIFEITGETDPCNRMDDVAMGLQDALMPDWRGGVTCRVIEGGTIAIGDPVGGNT
ncbi:MOSC domain-containing protein [Thalassospira sp.]|uniref:MOSC domain-containing protein n=1 Tax=Thalassospira sp. TaxID=1912094 RepID=UPI000C386443|nr:MOSC domain-containing protein [Thalassospira sp.]MBC07525.1 MOSC domain-containing protein [Thalassospira sp.]|tara:strand:+ start:9750 stop:10199 length:450 start_codon:yes stop_codon:yes gene_type:complete